MNSDKIAIWAGYTLITLATCIGIFGFITLCITASWHEPLNDDIPSYMTNETYSYSSSSIGNWSWRKQVSGEDFDFCRVCYSLTPDVEVYYHGELISHSDKIMYSTDKHNYVYDSTGEKLYLIASGSSHANTEHMDTHSIYDVWGYGEGDVELRLYVSKESIYFTDLNDNMLLTISHDSHTKIHGTSVTTWRVVQKTNVVIDQRLVLSTIGYYSAYDGGGEPLCYLIVVWGMVIFSLLICGIVAIGVVYVFNIDPSRFFN